MTSRRTDSACRIMRYLSLLFVSALGLATILATGGGGGGSSTSTSTNASSSITGRAFKGPIVGATIQIFYFDENGVEVEIVSIAAPVKTESDGSFNFPLDGEDLMGITSPLIVRASGGKMNGTPAPNLEGVIEDPQPLTFAQVAMTCNLSVASSVAAGLLRKYAESIKAAPTLNDAKRSTALVENQLRVDLSENPFDKRTRIGMFNECIDQNLDLPLTPGNNPAVGELIDYFIANLSSSSGLLDASMDDPENPGTEIPASFDSFSNLQGIIADPAGFILMNLTSDVTYVENDWNDTAYITVTLMDAAGRPYQELGEVKLGLVSGPGNLVSAGLSYARGEVLGKLTSDLTGNTGDVLVRTICRLSNNNDISLDVIVKSLDFQVDTDGDRFSDGDEELGWDIVIDELGYGSLATGALLNHRHVTSAPNLADTDGDGVSDYEEYLSRTDPRSADTDGDGLTDFEELYTWISNPNSVDTDGDARGPAQALTPNPALFDGNELALYRTSPILDDTDGDGRTDFEEIDHPTRSPLVSDLPKLEMEIVDAVDVRLDVSYAEEVGETYQYGNEMMKSTTRSTTKHNENSIEAGYKLGVSTTASGSFSLFDGFSAQVSTTVSEEFSFGYGHKWSTTEEEANTTQQSYSQYTTDSRTRTETAASGSMTAGIRLRNTGNIAFKLSELGITVRHGEMVWNEDHGRLVENFRTVATLLPALGGGIVLAPGEATPVLQVEAAGLNVNRVKELLNRPDSLYLETEHCEIESAEGLNYDFLKENTATRTASIIIDPGQGNAEEYRVATNVQRGFGGTYPGVTLGEILRDILRVDFSTIGRQHIRPDSPTNEQVLFRVRDVETDLTDPDLGFWAVVHESTNPPAGLYDFEQIPIRKGDRVLLIYVSDTDGNGVYDLHEEHYGIHDKEGNDYDGDGLNDKEELNGWEVSEDVPGAIPTYWVLSDPANADQDADGWNDSEERLHKTDPSNPDTDRDGIPDSDDPHPLFNAKVIYVDQNAKGNTDGSSWEHAYTDLQAALTEAKNGYDTKDDPTDDVAEIWVADGVYKPDANDRNVSFELVPTVGVYGGFLGKEGAYPGETKRSQRNSNPRTNSTVLSGDLAGDDPSYSDNSDTVVKAIEGEARYTIIDGFQISGGNNTYLINAGGMNVFRPVTLRNLFFYDNRSNQGPGALLIRLPDNEEITISRCVFTENRSVNTYSGGAILLYYNMGSVSLVDCILQGNTAPRGGAIGDYLGAGAKRLTLKNTVIMNNSATDGHGGGVVLHNNTPIKIVNCKFISNHATQTGGGLYATGNNDVQIIQSLFSNNLTSGTGEFGAAILVQNGFSLAITNSTIINNKVNANGGAGIGAHPPFKILRMDNAILWGNTTTSHVPSCPTGKPCYWDQFYITSEASWGPIEINTSCIEGFDVGQAYLLYGFGNIFDDPNLGGRDGATPQSGSPAIDAGNIYVDFEPLTPKFQSMPEIDLAGELRVVDGDDDGIAAVDMGAYEYQP